MKWKLCAYNLFNSNGFNFPEKFLELKFLISFLKLVQQNRQMYNICEYFVDLRKYICVIIFSVNRTHETRLFVINFNSGAVCFGCVVDSGYGLSVSLGDRKPASPKVSTKVGSQ